MKQARPTVLYAAAIRDATGVNASPGAVLVQDGRVVAAGEPASLPAELVRQAQVIDRPNDLLLPAFVNAHTHLELTDIGPQPYDPAGGFVGWVKAIRNKRTLRQTKMGYPDVQRLYHRQYVEPVAAGARYSMEAGVQAVGDIYSYEAERCALNRPITEGVVYAECFGIRGDDQLRSLLSISKSNGFTLHGLQPHAPYSAGPDLYAAVTREACNGSAVSTHLAETAEELRFVARGDGPLLGYLQKLSKWEDVFAKYYGKGLSPVHWMRPYLERAAAHGGWLVAHCNYVDDDDIKLLADTNTSVAYCPIASEYFGHKDHRYRDMLATGVNVCLGTDSIVGTDPYDPQPLGLLSAMRRLYQRDQTNPQTLLAMATTHGTRALRLDDKLATLKPGAPARFACVPIDPDSDTDPLIQVLTGQAPVKAISFE